MAPKAFAVYAEELLWILKWFSWQQRMVLAILTITFNTFEKILKSPKSKYTNFQTHHVSFLGKDGLFILPTSAQAFLKIATVWS